jgi:hypothetical protein
MLATPLSVKKNSGFLIISGIEIATSNLDACINAGGREELWDLYLMKERFLY